MNGDQSKIVLTMTQEWRIRRPQVYRMLEKQYVDEFFRDGSIRISSFAKFSKHQNEQKNDPHDGGYSIITHVGKCQDREPNCIIAGYTPPQNCYVLSGTTLFSEELRNSFGYDSGFRINDPTLFAAEISRQIQGFAYGLEGACLYKKYRKMSKVEANLNFEQFESGDISAGMDPRKISHKIDKEYGEDALFLKDDTYQNQMEYRLIWFTENAVLEHLDIKCPRAISYCTKIVDLNGLE